MKLWIFPVEVRKELQLHDHEKDFERKVHDHEI